MKTPKTGPAATGDPVADLMAHAETITVPRVEAVRALPGADLDLHLEAYFRALAREQVFLHHAQGEEAARPHAARAAELVPLTAVPSSRLSTLDAKAGASTRLLSETLASLGPFRTRPRGAVARYYLFLLLLLGGDLAGMTGALISLGEVPWIAAVQAMAVAAAAVVVGMLASEVKHLRDARRRMGTGGDDGRRGVLFQPDGGEAVVRWVLLGGLAVLLLIAGGVTALRSATDGAGWIFGLFAAAVTLGSAANSYVHSDEVADLLDNLTRQHRRDDAELRALDLGPLAEHEREQALAESLRMEWKQRGQAAEARVLAAGALALVNNPAVSGHGRPNATAVRTNGHLPVAKARLS